MVIICHILTIDSYVTTWSWLLMVEGTQLLMVVSGDSFTLPHAAASWYI